MMVLLFGALLLPVAEAQQSDGADEASPTREFGRIQYIDVPVPFGAQMEPNDGVATTQANALPALAEAQMLARREAIAAYSARVTKIESAGGVWDQGLVEELAALGRAQQELGEHAAAVDTLSRALHVNRINAGLHTLEQVPVVEAMIESYTALGDWGQADLYQNYLYYVQHRAYGIDDPRMIPVLERLGCWNLEAFTVGAGEPLGLRLFTAQ